MMSRRTRSVDTRAEYARVSLSWTGRADKHARDRGLSIANMGYSIG